MVDFTYDKNLRAIPVSETQFRKRLIDLRESIASTEMNALDEVNALGELGVLERIIGEMEASSASLHRALAISRENNLGRRKEIQNEIRLAHLLQFQKEYSKSNALFERIIGDCESDSELSYFLPFAYQHHGKNLFDQERFQEALIFFRKTQVLRIGNAPEEQIESTRFAISTTLEMLNEKS